MCSLLMILFSRQKNANTDGVERAIDKRDQLDHFYSFDGIN